MLRITIINEDKGKVILDKKCASITGVTHDGKGGGVALAILNGTPVHVASMASNLLDLVKKLLKDYPQAAALLLADDLFRFFKEDKTHE